MNEETLGIIDKLAEKLGTTAEYLLMVVANQAEVVVIHKITGILFWLVFFIIACYIGFKYIFKQYNEFRWLSSIGFVIILLIVMSQINNHVDVIFTATLNPEYWALDNILSKIK